MDLIFLITSSLPIFSISTSFGYLLWQTFLTIRSSWYPTGMWGKKQTLLLLYWYHVQAAQDGVSDIIIGKFFDVRYFTANGINPAFRRYKNKNNKNV